MTTPQPKSLLPISDAAMLLVLLPVSGQLKASSSASLDRLQQRLGAAVRIMKIDEATHPAVVRSFHATELPACVLVRQGIELWRQPGLPEEENAITLLLSQLDPVEPPPQLQPTLSP
ncbi:thioredoxin [Hymenobacter koreensis]